MIRTIFFAFLLLALGTSVFAAPKQQPLKTNLVDVGSFSVYVNGQRVATERFRIEQAAQVSMVTSDLTAEDGKVSQHSELQLSPNGDLRRYEWRESSPNKSRIIVEPIGGQEGGQFLVERIFSEPNSKPHEKPFLLPPTSPILDDYFFSHRQILLWRYIATACTSGKECRPGKTQFGVVIPRQQISAPIFVEYSGRERIPIHGTERELDKFVISAEDSAWSVWMDNDLKVQKILVPANNTEVLRD